MSIYKEDNTIGVIRLGGSTFGDYGKNTECVINRMKNILKESLRTVYVFSCPRGVTDSAIHMGEEATKGNPTNGQQIWRMYEKLSEQYIKDSSLREEFLNSKLMCYKKDVSTALVRLRQSIQKKFIGPDKAIVLGSCGELPTTHLMGYVLTSLGYDVSIVDFDSLPIITDNNFDRASPIHEKCKERMNMIEKNIEENKPILSPGFVGKTTDSIPTIFPRGGGDLTGAIYATVLTELGYKVILDFEKDTSVRRANPKIISEEHGLPELGVVSCLTINETLLASTHGSEIVNPYAIRYIRDHYSPNLEIIVRNINNPMEVTRIQKEDLNAYAVSNKTAKIITGKEKCALVAIDRSKGDSLEDHLKMDDLIENEDYIPLFRDNLNGKSAMCYLFLQSEYLTNNNRENEKRLRVLDDKCKIDYDIGIVAIVGDRLREATGIAGSVFGSLGNRKIKTLANLATPYSSKILALVKENEVPDAVRAVYWGVTR